jgi:hypothetical protein
MKKTILFATISLTISTTPSFGLGYILLDNYASSGQPITYGPGGLGPVGTGLGVGWTVGFYYALGDVRGAIADDPTGYADPSTLGGGLTLATGSGTTTTFIVPGYFAATETAVFPGNPKDTITLMVVAYYGANYGSALSRGHSSTFTMPLGTLIGPDPSVGHYMPGFSVPIPEPAALVLGGFMAAASILYRRKQG